MTATNGAGTSTAVTFTLTIIAKPTLSYSSATGTQNSPMSVSPASINNNGSAITSCDSVTALPAGLSVSSPGCVISGTPTVTITATAYTIRATNSAGSTDASVTLTINPNTVTISQYTGYRGWSNGTFARTCHEYRYPTAPYQYSGVTGDGIYRIDPDGAGVIAPLNVSCNMTNGGWTYLSAFATTSSTYTRNGIFTSGDLVTSNSAAYTAIANLSTQQTVSYNANFTGNSTQYSCPYSNGQWVSLQGGPVDGGCWISYYPTQSINGGTAVVSESGPRNYPFTCHLYINWVTYTSGYCGCDGGWFDENGSCCMLSNAWYATNGVYCGGGTYCDYCCANPGSANTSRNIYTLPYYACPFGGSDLQTTKIPDCSLTVRFLNSGTTVLHTPISSQEVVNESKTRTFNLNSSGGVRKIQTQTSCSGSGANLSNGVNFKENVIFYGANSTIYGTGTTMLDGTILAGELNGKSYFTTPSDSGSMSWSTGKSFCNNLVAHGKDDWFLPDRDQLQFLFQNRSLLGFGTGWYWSSVGHEQCQPNSAAWDLNFSSGAWYSNGYSCGNAGWSRAIRCIRME